MVRTYRKVRAVTTSQFYAKWHLVVQSSLILFSPFLLIAPMDDLKKYYDLTKYFTIANNIIFFVPSITAARSLILDYYYYYYSIPPSTLLLLSYQSPRGGNPVLCAVKPMLADLVDECRGRWMVEENNNNFLPPPALLSFPHLGLL